MIVFTTKPDSGASLKLHFQRFEFKYILQEDLAAAIRRRIAEYVVPDPFAEHLPAGSYEVFSLYFDSPGFYYYWQKIDGIERRKKVRLRTYRNTGNFEQYAFFELKRKHDAVILKDRFVMTKDDYKALIENEDFSATEMRDQNRRNIVEEFEWERHMRSISPKVLVAYVREPYLGRYNQNFRVTFDSQIKAVENDNLFYAGNDWVDVSGNHMVMELKFTGVLPFYINRVIKEFNLERTTYSKYTNAVEACGSLAAGAPLQPAGLMQAKGELARWSTVEEGVFGV